MSVGEHEMRHDLLVYDSDDGFARFVGLFVEEGVEAGHPTVVVTGPRQRAVLTDTLTAADAEAVRFIDRDGFYTRPEKALADYDAILRGLFSQGADAVRLYGELPDHKVAEDWASWLRYEASLNRLFAGQPIWVTCGYDARRLPQEVLDGAWRAHREVHLHGWRENPHYEDPVHVARSLAPAYAELPSLRSLPVVEGEAALRHLLARELESAGVDADVASEMLAAAVAVLVNAQQHGGGLRSLRTGRVEGRFVCEIADAGPGLDDPFAGYLPPRRRGDPAGLWRARQLTAGLDLLSPGTGLTVRLWV